MSYSTKSPWEYNLNPTDKEHLLCKHKKFEYLIKRPKKGIHFSALSFRRSDPDPNKVPKNGRMMLEVPLNDALGCGSNFEVDAVANVVTLSFLKKTGLERRCLENSSKKFFALKWASLVV